MRELAALTMCLVLALGFAGKTVAADPLSARVAVPAPMSGLRAAMGRSLQAAARLIAADIAARGAIVLEIVPIEDNCTSIDAPRAAEALAAGAFDVVVGLPCSASALAASAVFARTGQLLIATAPLVPPYGLTRTGRTVVRLPVAQRSLGHFLGDRLAAAPPEARIVVIRDKTQQAIGLAASIDTAVRAGGRAVAAVEVFSGGDKAFGPIVARLKVLGATQVALLAFPVEGALLARELAAAIPEVEIYGPDFLAMEETGIIAAEAAPHLRMVLPAQHPLGQTEASRNLADRLSAQGIQPTREAVVAAVAVEVYAAALLRAGSREPQAISAQLAAPIETPFGIVTFDARGHMVVPYWAIHRWHEGRWVEPR